VVLQRDPGRRRWAGGACPPPCLSQFQGMSLSRAITSHTNCSGGSDGASSLVSAGAWRQAPHAVQPGRPGVAAHYLSKLPVESYMWLNAEYRLISSGTKY